MYTFTLMVIFIIHLINGESLERELTEALRTGMKSIQQKQMDINNDLDKLASNIAKLLMKKCGNQQQKDDLSLSSPHSSSHSLKQFIDLLNNIENDGNDQQASSDNNEVKIKQELGDNSGGQGDSMTQDGTMRVWGAPPCIDCS